MLLCRVNSSNDVNFGATGHPRLVDSYYSVRGRRKHFFDRAAVENLFASGWRVLSLDELHTPKYGRDKVLWEVILQRVE